MNNIDELYKNEDEESIVDIEEAVEDTVETEVHNTTASMSKDELTLMICNSDNKEILNQTLPIVQEHVRKWKAAGLDRILNTFDEQKIERHVGDWLRRHNSAYGDKTLQQMSPTKLSRRRYTATDHVYSPDVSNESETESMHSVDTARYIRASRKRTVSTASKCSSPMTTIKMYRTLPRKRDELRAKYGCDEYNEDQEHRHHMQALRHRRDQLHRCNRERGRERELIYHTTPSHYPYRVAASFNGQQRRKQLRKRHDSSPHFPSSSSSEDETGHSRCNCSACMRRAFSMTTHPYYGYRSYHMHSLYHHQRLELESRTSHSLFKRSVRQLRRQHSFEDDLRPRLLESDYKCCNNDRLCSNVVHIANRSTEEWVVENESSPDLMQLKTPSKCRFKTINSTLRSKLQRKCQPISVLAEQTDEDSEDMLEENTILDKEYLPEDKPMRKALQKFINADVVPKSITSLSSNNITVPEISKESVKSNNIVNNEPMAKSNKVKGSYQKQKLLTSEKRGSVSEKNVKSNKATSTVGNARQKPKKGKMTSNESDDSDADFKLAVSLSMQTFLSEKKKSLQSADPKLSGETSASPSNLPEQSTFNEHSVACNSTAVSIDAECAHSMKNLMKLPINTIATTSQQISDELSSTDGDCTIVTSTTGCETAAAVAKPTIKLTKKGYLLYAPSNRQQNCNSSNFTLTEDSLSPIIGLSKARKFLKYYTGSRSFDKRYSVYYRPTAKMADVLSARAKSVDYQSSSSSGSESDIFDRIHRYGDVYLEKNIESD